MPVPALPAGVSISSFDVNYHRSNQAGQVIFEGWLSGPGILSSGCPQHQRLETSWLIPITSFSSSPRPSRPRRARTHCFAILTAPRSTIWARSPSAACSPGPASMGITTRHFGWEPPAIFSFWRRPPAAPGGLIYGDSQGFDFPVLSPRGNVAFLSSIAGNAGPGTVPAPSSPALQVISSSWLIRMSIDSPGTNTTFRDIHGGWNTPRINDKGGFLRLHAQRRHGRRHLVGKARPASARRSHRRCSARDRTQYSTNSLDLGLNEKGDVTYRADTAPEDDNSFAIYAGRPNDPDLVAATGQHAPGTEDGVDFAMLTDPVINEDGQVAFFGYLTEEIRGPNDYGIFATGHAGDLRLIARYGDDFKLRGKIFARSWPSRMPACSARIFSLSTPTAIWFFWRSSAMARREFSPPRSCRSHRPPLHYS